MPEVPKTSETLDIARELVFKYHKGQYRRHLPLPFDAHPYLVAHRLAKWGITDKHPYVIECGLTHDIIEDAGERAEEAKEEIYHRLGVHYYNINVELTFVYDPSLGTSKNAQKAEYLASFEWKSVESLVIKDADRTYNSEDFEPTEGDAEYDPQRQIRYLRSANVLFQITARRRREIEAAFGVNFYRKMSNDIIQLHEKLNLNCPAMF